MDQDVVGAIDRLTRVMEQGIDRLIAISYDLEQSIRNFDPSPPDGATTLGDIDDTLVKIADALQALDKEDSDGV